MTERKKSGIAAMLEGKTAALGERLDTAKESDSSIQNKPPVTMPGQLGAFRLQAQQWQKRIDELEKQLDEAKKGGQRRKLPVCDLVEVPGRRRKLTADDYNDMKENIRETGKILEPIRVAPRADGKWDIISGNNKTAIVRELGWDEVDCLIDEVDHAQAELDGFFANLFQNKLPDYEQYLGFKMMQQHFPDDSLSDIARRSGKPKSVVSEMMAFEGLPPDVHKLLTNHPHLLGHRAAAQLANLTKKGMENEVAQAVRSIATLGIEQTEAVKQVEQALVASQANAPKAPPKPKREPMPIKSGRSTYCTFHSAAKVLRIEFESKEEREAIEDAIREVLQKRADAMKDKK